MIPSMKTHYQAAKVISQIAEDIYNSRQTLLEDSDENRYAYLNFRMQTYCQLQGPLPEDHREQAFDRHVHIAFNVNGKICYTISADRTLSDLPLVFREDSNALRGELRGSDYRRYVFSDRICPALEKQLGEDLVMISNNLNTESDKLYTSYFLWNTFPLRFITKDIS